MHVGKYMYILLCYSFKHTRRAYNFVGSSILLYMNLKQQCKSSSFIIMGTVSCGFSLSQPANHCMRRFAERVICGASLHIVAMQTQSPHNAYINMQEPATYYWLSYVDLSENEVIKVITSYMETIESLSIYTCKLEVFFCYSIQSNVKLYRTTSCSFPSRTTAQYCEP